MRKIKYFFTNSKYNDWGYIGILLLSFIIFAFYLGHIYGNLFMDCGREAVLPKMMLEGKILYKDIFGMYNPFSYQINAFLYLVFGVSLNTLYGAAYVNAFLILIGFYFICKRFISGYYSFAITFMLMCVYIFGCTSLMSYLFPYAFAFPYAVTCLTYSVLTFLIYTEKGENKYALLSGFLIGLSVANKYEFIFCITPMLIVMAFNKEKIKTFLSYILLFVFPMFYSYALLFMQGFTFNDLLNYIQFNKDFFNTDEQIYYTSNYIMTDINEYTLLTLIKYFAFFAIICVCIIGYLYLFKKGKYYKLFAIGILPLFLPRIYNYIMWYSNINYFCWITIGIGIIIYFLGDKEKTAENKMLLFLAVTGLLSMTRINFIPINKFGYGIYMLLPIIAVWIYFIKTDIKYLKNINYKKYISLTFIIISILYILATKENISVNNIKTETSKGTIIQPETEVKMFENLTDWINKNTKEKESVLIMPEGVMLNFVTGRPTKPMYYHLIPNHISALGEDKIVEILNMDKPDYIIINSAKYPMYAKTEMCNDFAEKICKFTNKNYDIVQEYNTLEIAGEPFTAKIYKLKKN